MKLIKSILVSVLLCVLMGAAGYYVLIHNLLPTNIAQAISVTHLGPTLDGARSQIQILAQRAETLGFHTEKVLGTAIEKNEEETPLHQRALEYGRYLYCQQVIKEYETQNTPPNQSSSSPSN